MSIATRLRTLLDEHVDTVLRTLPTYRLAEEGRLSAAQLAAYLANLGWIMNQSFKSVAFAAEESARRDRPVAHAYYTTKLKEEIEHHAWAYEDVSRLEKDFQIRADFEPSVQARALIAAHQELILKDPAFYITYVFYTEYVTITVGPDWMRLLRDRCGFDTSHFGVIDRHIELDQAHTAENMRDVDRIASEAGLSEAEMVAALQVSMDAYAQVYSSLPMAVVPGTTGVESDALAT